MPRRTKIVATLGPASDSAEILEQLIRAGVDVFRLNFSHGEAADHQRRAERVRQAAATVGRDVGILADLQGPKIRIDRFRDGRVTLEEGAAFCLDAELDAEAGTSERVGIAYKDLPRDVSPGDRLLLDDGLIVMRVTEVEGARVHCEVELGGQLSNNKGINRLGGGLSAGALTDKDRQDIVTAASMQVDYVAVSFPRSADDIHAARALLTEAGSRAGIVAKIERAEAVDAIEEIVVASDVVMVARGDLGVEIGDAELPGVQKRIISVARALNRVVITATQMMESMISQPAPTRAEVLDVANAVMDGTDAVMLSAETAAGKYPVRTVEAMDRVCLGAERQRFTQRSGHRMDSHFERIDEAIAMATMYTANHLEARAIISLTESGSTALWMSRISSGIPIYALTQHEATRRRVTLYRGVYPVGFEIMRANPNVVVRDAVNCLRGMNAVADGDLVVITKGDLTGVAGGTNTMKILRVGEEPDPVE
ncbi:pyruvate kinase [Natronocella acetinitrilica]|uniref:Pyruvate kinase n=1 Tax=Natronocella acetinitrilica TaxID=414046 RepID=A0AAE3G4F2_9GAMM|nr:pyruvate kinase [Natronocella acetinitrilica]MCP1674894.1 pyruvate kinase [Natronocella acetinitrilica]